MHRTDLNALAVIMRHAARDQIVTPGVLRKELNLSSPATTALIDRLHSSGHVVREREGADRRQVQLRMTPKAYRDGGAMFLPLARHMGAAMANFTPEELEIVTRFMNSMIDATVRAGQEAARGRRARGVPADAARSCAASRPADRQRLRPAADCFGAASSSGPAKAPADADGGRCQCQRDHERPAAEEQHGQHDTGRHDHAVPGRRPGRSNRIPAARPNAVTAVKHADAAPIWNCMLLSPADGRPEGQERHDGQQSQAGGGHLARPGAPREGRRQHAVGRQARTQPAGAGNEGVDRAEGQHRGGDRGSGAASPPSPFSSSCATARRCRAVPGPARRPRPRQRRCTPRRPQSA